jgi:hypothetical protein
MGPTVFSLPDVNRLNNGLRTVVANITEQRHLAFSATRGEDTDALEAATRGRRVGFELRGAGATGRARRDLDGEVCVAPLRKRFNRGPYHVWVGGYIEWEKLVKKQFALITLDWFFAAGRERSDENIVLLRAEWFHDRSHPQPHWHFDQDIFVPRYGTSSGDVATGSLGRLHLPMAGWNNEPDYPLCWSHAANVGPEVFIDWSDRIIRLAADQIEYLLDHSGV